MTFLVDFSNDTLNDICFVTICLNKTSADECSTQVHCGFQWFTPEPTVHPTAHPTTHPTAHPTTHPTDDGMTTDADIMPANAGPAGPCEQNTWLWLVDSKEIGEAHFIVGNNILNNVSTLQLQQCS